MDLVKRLPNSNPSCLFPVFRGWSNREEASIQHVNLISNTLLSTKCWSNIINMTRGYGGDQQKQIYQKIQPLELNRNSIHHWLSSSKLRCAVSVHKGAGYGLFISRHDQTEFRSDRQLLALSRKNFPQIHSSVKKPADQNAFKSFCKVISSKLSPSLFA